MNDERDIEESYTERLSWERRSKMRRMRVRVAMAFIVATLLFATWQFIVVPKVYWESRVVAPEGPGCPRVFVLLDNTGNDSNTSDNPFRDTAIGQLAGVIEDPSCTIYVPGTSARASGVQRTLASVFGLGDGEGRESAYLQLLHTASPTSTVVILGAGTGALKAVMLAHMLNRIGLSRVRATFDTRSETPVRLEPLDPSGSVTVSFLGLFDMRAAPFSPIHHQFANGVPVIDVPPNVRRAVHVIGLNDPRSTFAPVHINTSETSREVWFVGTHADVAGGNGNVGANVRPRLHMLEELKREGLPLRIQAWTDMTSDLSVPPQPSRIRGGDYVRSVDVFEKHQRSSKPPLLHRSVTPETARRPLPATYVIVDDPAR